jgi:hypothetical protein
MPTNNINWDNIKYKNPCPTTLSFVNDTMINERFENHKNKYNDDNMNVLTHFRKFKISDKIYDDQNAWTFAQSSNEESYATHLLYQNNFVQGTYRITKAGYYELQEDIIFSPDPRGDESFMPTDLQIENHDYPTFETTPTGYYAMGFFAAITIEAPDVILNLNGYSIKQSQIHKLQQRFFSCIELASAPFTQGAGGDSNKSHGPHQFGPTPISTADNLYICNGELSASSHHGIHGNSAKNVIIENMNIVNYEVGAIQINGGKNIIIRNINISNSGQDVRVNFKYSQARFIDRFLNLIKQEQPELTLNLSTGVKSIDDIIHDLSTARDIVKNHIKTNTELPTTGSASVFKLKDADGLLDGNAYGIILAQQGPIVGDFKKIRNEMGVNENIVLHDIIIQNLETNVSEILACSSNKETSSSDIAYGGARVADPVGGILDLFFASDENGHFKENVLINAQLICGKAVLNGLSQSGTTNIPIEIINWAENGTQQLNTIINGIDFCYIGFGDCMGHHMKGNIGIFVQGGLDIDMSNIIIENMQNYGTIGTEYKKLEGYHGADTVRTYMGTQNSGIAIVGSKNIDLNNFQILQIASKNGISHGISCIGNNEDVNIFDYHMRNIVSAKPSLQASDPNPKLKYNLINLDTTSANQISCDGHKMPHTM